MLRVRRLWTLVWSCLALRFSSRSQFVLVDHLIPSILARYIAGRDAFGRVPTAPRGDQSDSYPVSSFSVHQNPESSTTHPVPSTQHPSNQHPEPSTQHQHFYKSHQVLHRLSENWLRTSSILHMGKKSSRKKAAQSQQLHTLSPPPLAVITADAERELEPQAIMVVEPVQQLIGHPFEVLLTGARNAGLEDGLQAGVRM